jgi:hypothetical protein
LLAGSSNFPEKILIFGFRARYNLSCSVDHPKGDEICRRQGPEDPASMRNHHLVEVMPGLPTAPAPVRNSMSGY